MGRRGRRRKQLLNELKEAREYWKMKERALGRTVWKTRFGRCCGPVAKIDHARNENALVRRVW